MLGLAAVAAAQNPRAAGAAAATAATAAAAAAAAAVGPRWTGPHCLLICLHSFRLIIFLFLCISFISWHFWGPTFHFCLLFFLSLFVLPSGLSCFS